MNDSNSTPFPPGVQLDKLVERLATLEDRLAGLDRAPADFSPVEVVRQTRDFLQNNHRLFEQIFEVSHLGIALLDRDFNFLRVNRVYARQNEQDLDFFPGKNHFDLFPGPAKPIFAEVLQTGQPYTARALPFSSPLQPERGVTYWDWTVQPSLDVNGVPNGLMLFTLDVTAEVNAKIELGESREMFEGLFESAPDAVILIDAHGVIQLLNRQAELTFGYHRSDLSQQPIELLIHSEAPPDAPRFYQSNLSGALPGSGSSLFGVRRGGTSFPVEITVNSVPYGQSYRMICTLRDVTSQLQMRQAASEQAAYVRLLQDIAIASNEAMTFEGAIQYALDRICAHTGWPVGHAVLLDHPGRLVSARLWHLENQQSLEAFRRKSELMEWDAVSGGLPVRVLNKNRADWVTDLYSDPEFRRSDEARVANLQAMFGFPLMVGSEPVGVLEFFSTTALPPDHQMLDVMAHIGTQLGRVVERERNQKALQRSEARFRAIFEESAIGIQLNDLEGYFLESNPALQRMLGYDADELRGLLLSEITHPDDRQENWERLKQLLRGEESQYQKEIRYLRKDGTLMWAQITVSLVYDAQSRAQFVITLVYDVTARKTIENELEELRRRLQDSVEDERLRLAMQLHDGPLQNLYGASFYLQDMLPNVPKGEVSETIQNAQTIVQGVIESLRVMVGEMRPPTLIPFGLEKAIRSHMERWQMHHPHLTVHLDLMRDGLTLNPQTRLMLFRAYQQLLSNVARHAEASNLWVRLIVEPEEMILEVEDDGQGFEAPLRWIELARVGHTGLLGVSERAEDFGGSMEIVSKPEQGSLVRVRVPYQANAAAAAAAAN